MPTSRLERPKPIKIFCGLIGRAETLAEATGLLCRRLGSIDCESPVIDFKFTTYYSNEMGNGLSRRWVSFGVLRERAYLASAKHLAVAVERRLSAGGRRTVNIDPGYVDDAQVVLSTAKNYSHRIYIGMGYYAEPALLYEHKAFKVLDWTFPDYKTPEALSFFANVRAVYLGQIRSGTPPTALAEGCA